MVCCDGELLGVGGDQTFRIGRYAESGIGSLGSSWAKGDPTRTVMTPAGKLSARSVRSEIRDLFFLPKEELLGAVAELGRYGGILRAESRYYLELEALASERCDNGANGHLILRLCYR